MSDAETPIFPDAVEVGGIIYPPGSTLGPRTQINLQLVIMLRGQMTVWVDDNKYTAQAGTVTLLLPVHREYFEFTKNDETEHRWLHFYAENLPEPLLKRMRYLPRTINLSAEMASLTERALRLQHTNLSTTEMILKSLALQMIWLYIGEGEQINNGELTPRNETIGKAIVYINQHLSEDIQLRDIAHAVSVSENHLIRLFKRHLNTTPISYLWERRIAHAIDLLQRTGLSIGQIASECGFKTSYHFSRRIRQATGFTPTQLRNQSWR